jgi:hypothetical protein
MHLVLGIPHASPHNQIPISITTTNTIKSSITHQTPIDEFQHPIQQQQLPNPDIIAQTGWGLGHTFIGKTWKLPLQRLGYFTIIRHHKSPAPRLEVGANSASPKGTKSPVLKGLSPVAPTSSRGAIWQRSRTAAKLT